jgi:iron complex outermembrane receptor protein
MRIDRMQWTPPAATAARESRRVPGALLCVALAAVPTLSFAAGDPADLASLPIERLLDLEIEGASKVPQKITAAPSLVTVVSAAEIRDHGYRSLADILRTVPGLYVSNDRNYEYLGARGFGRPGDYNTRVLLLVDGQRINDNVYDGALIDRSFPVHVDLIERVEFVPGPASGVYGSNALLGVINVVTRRARDIDGVELSAEAGSRGARGARATLGRRAADGMDLLLSASRNHSDGANLHYPEFASPATNNGWAMGLDYENRRDLFLKASRGELTLTVAHAEREKGIPTASYGQVFNDPRSRTIDAQSFINLQIDHAVSDARRVQGRLYHGRYDYQGDYVYDNPPATVNRDVTEADWWGGEIKLIEHFAGGHTLVVGGEYQSDMRRDQLNYDVTPYLSYLDDRRPSHRSSAYVQGEAMLSEKLTASLGLRHDAYADTADTTSPRLALVYRPRPQSVIKAIYGSAYRVPNIYERYYAIGASNEASPDLRPERISTLELVAEERLGERLRLTGSVYRYKMHELINLTTDPATGLLVFRNLDNVEARGAEFGGEWHGEEVRARASVSFHDTHDEATEQVLTNAPRRLAKLNVSAPLATTALRAGLDAQYVSRRRTLAGDVGGYTVANLTLTHRGLIKGMELSFSAYNLFDKSYSDPGSVEHLQDAIAQDDRSVRFKLTYRF